MFDISLRGNLSFEKDVDLSRGTPCQPTSFMSKFKMRRYIVVSIALCGGFLQGAQIPVEYESVSRQAVFTPLPEFYLSQLEDAYYSFYLTVDPKTGSVTHIEVKESSNNSPYKYKLLESLHRWKFKPGAPGLIHVAFGMERVVRDDPSRQRHVKAVNDLLEPFLGKRAVLYGALPNYPTNPPWPTKRG